MGFIGRIQNNIHQGYMWLYHSPVDRLVLFDYQKGRDQSGPKKMLADFRGIIQTDGFTVYDSLFGDHPDIHLTFCIACPDYFGGTCPTEVCGCCKRR